MSNGFGFPTDQSLLGSTSKETVNPVNRDQQVTGPSVTEPGQTPGRTGHQTSLGTRLADEGQLIGLCCSPDECIYGSSASGNDAEPVINVSHAFVNGDFAVVIERVSVDDGCLERFYRMPVYKLLTKHGVVFMGLGETGE